MSSDNSASHAAALAAFKSLNKGSESSNHIFKVPEAVPNKKNQSHPRSKTLSSKPRLSHIETSKPESSAAARSAARKNSMVSAGPQTPKCTVIVQSPLSSTPHDKGRSRHTYITETMPTHSRQNSSSSVRGSISKRKEKEANHTNSQTKAQAQAQESIRNVKSSIDSKAISNDMKLKRLSANYEPQEMINNIKNSINAYKLSESSSQEIAEKSRKTISDIKESINSKQKLSTISTPELLSSISDVSVYQTNNDSVGSNKDFFKASKHSIHNDTINTNSYSSLGSALSESYPETPIIVIDKNLDQGIRGREELDFNNHKIIAHNSTVNRSHSDASKSYSSEIISPSNAVIVLSKDGFTGSESGSKDSLNDYSSGKEFEAYSINKSATMDYFKLKPNRKPPPDIRSNSSGMESFNGNDEFIDLHSIQSGVTGYDSRKGSLYEITYKESSRMNNDSYLYFSNDPSNQIPARSDAYGGKSPTDTSDFPRFPDIGEKKKSKQHEHKTRHIFKRSRKTKGVDDTVNFLQSDDEDEEFKSDANGTSGNREQTSTNLGAQPVRLKTTMRKANKRKEKKLQFNENKPWKNHYDLDTITDNERKRYEGVWASNKGLYMDCVVTKLLGVDYNNGLNPKAIDVDSEEISRRAARLSSHNRFSDNGTLDTSNFHNLVTADIDQLIHAVVVKRLWKRSRLPDETLATIWNLVDFRKDGSLNKVEFLVGMWLVDQCLYGRKLPKKVEDSIWDSLGGIGVNVVIKKKGKR